MRDENKLKALIIIILFFCFIYFMDYQKEKLEFQRENNRINTINKAIDELSKNNDNLTNILNNKLK